MAGRPANRVEIGVLEFIKLAYLMLACHENDVDIGDCNLMQGAIEMLNDIGANSNIRLTLEQLDSLVFHYKQAVMYRFSPVRNLKIIPEEYQSLMRNIQKYCPNNVVRNRYGELIVTGFNHKYHTPRRRRNSFREEVMALEKEKKDKGLPDDLDG